MGEEIRSCAGKCVLVVDDNEFNRELVREILEDEAIIVYESDDGKSAVDFMDKAGIIRLPADIKAVRK